MEKTIKKTNKKHGSGALRPKAVLFDMDGVLYDSMPQHVVAWHDSMALFGIEMSREDAYATEGARGVDTIRHMVRLQKGKDITEQEAQRMYEEKSRLFHAAGEAPLMPGIFDLMRRIKASGIAIGVVTGSGQRPLIQRIYNDFAEYVTPEHVVTAYDVKQGKPSPDPYLMGLKKMGDLAPNEAVVIENAPLGVRAGVAAGIYTIAVNTGPLPNDYLLREGCNALYPSIQSLADDWNRLFKNSLAELPRKKIFSQDERWDIHYDTVMEFMERNNKRPSKYKKEEIGMVYWIRNNRRRMEQGKLAPERAERMKLLLEKAASLHRVNQYT